MSQKITLKKDGKKCEISFKETKKGLKAETSGSGCKKIMGKDYFKDMELNFPD